MRVLPRSESRRGWTGKDKGLFIQMAVLLSDAIVV